MKGHKMKAFWTVTKKITPRKSGEKFINRVSVKMNSVLKYTHYFMR